VLRFTLGKNASSLTWHTVRNFCPTNASVVTEYSLSKISQKFGYITPPKLEIRKQVAADIRNIFNASDAHHAEEELGRFVDRYQETAPKLAGWAEANLAEGLAIFGIPSEHLKRMRATNMLERQNRELKRRTRVASLFPNEASLLRLVTAVLVELSDEWETGMRYLTFQK